MDVTVPAGTFTPNATTGLRFATGSWAGTVGAWAAGVPVTFERGQVEVAFGLADLAAAVQAEQGLAHVPVLDMQHLPWRLLRITAHNWEI